MIFSSTPQLLFPLCYSTPHMETPTLQHSIPPPFPPAPTPSPIATLVPAAATNAPSLTPNAAMSPPLLFVAPIPLPPLPPGNPVTLHYRKLLSQPPPLTPHSNPTSQRSPPIFPSFRPRLTNSHCGLTLKFPFISHPPQPSWMPHQSLN